MLPRNSFFVLVAAVAGLSLARVSAQSPQGLFRDVESKDYFTAAFPGAVPRFGPVVTGNFNSEPGLDIASIDRLNVGSADPSGRFASFGPAAPAPVGGLPNIPPPIEDVTVVADFNGDGLDDVVRPGPLVYFANPNGVFSPAVTLGLRRTGSMVAVDPDLDGDLDLVGVTDPSLTTPTGDREIRVYPNVGGALGPAVISRPGTGVQPFEFRKLVALQLDGFGPLELFGTGFGLVPPFTPYVSLSFGPGFALTATPQFPSGLLPPGSPPIPIAFDFAVEDLDGDGLDDLLTRWIPIELLNTGAGFVASQIPGLLSTVAVDYVDVDGDGLRDRVYTDDDGQLNVSRRNATGVFDPAVLVADDAPAVGFPILSGDFDGDSLFDLLVGDRAGSVRLFIGQGGGSFLVPSATGFFAEGVDSSGIRSLAIPGDFDGDSRSDLGFFDGSRFSFLLQGPLGGFTDLVGPPLPIGLFRPITRVVDVDGDGTDELLFFDGASPTLFILSPMTGAITTVPVSNTLIDVASGDVDGDGDLDLVASLLTGDDRLLRNEGAMTFTEIPNAIPLVNNFAGNAVLFDVDGDGDLDRVEVPGFPQTGSTAAQLIVDRNDGAGTFTRVQALLVSVPSNMLFGFSTPSILDLEGDGDLDLVVELNTFFESELRALENDGTGSFSVSSITLTSVLGRIPEVEFADVDEDGDSDYLTVRDGQLRFHENFGGGVFDVEGVLVRGASDFAGLSVVDLDGDRDLDLLVGEDVSLNRRSDLRTPLFPRLGRPYEIDLTLLDDPATMGVSLGAILVGGGLAPNRTPFGFSNLLNPVTLTIEFFNDVVTTNSFSVTIPNNTALLGAEIFSQAVFARTDGGLGFDVFFGATAADTVSL